MPNLIIMSIHFTYMVVLPILLGGFLSYRWKKAVCPYCGVHKLANGEIGLIRHIIRADD